MRLRAVLASAAPFALAALGPAQAASPVDLKIGLSQGDHIGAYAGVDFRLPRFPLRLDVDGYSTFGDFGKRSAGVGATLNYIRPLAMKSSPGLYGGIGLGYVGGKERDDRFDSFGAKFTVGSRLPGTSLGIEGSLLWAVHAIGQIHTVGTLSLVYRL